MLKQKRLPWIVYPGFLGIEHISFAVNAAHQLRNTILSPSALTQPIK